MARTYLSDNETSNQIGGLAHDDLIGTQGVQVVNLNGNANVTFDASFNAGGDTIRIAGDSGAYAAHLEDSNLVITGNGADIVIPLGTDGITIEFTGDDASFVALIDGDSAFIGDIEVPLDGSEVDLGDGSTPPPPPTSGEEYLLEPTRDNITGTAGDDTFIADIVQNQNGEQTNSLGTGDRLKGAGGEDLLQAQVQDASALNASPSSALRPIMDSIETVHFNATQWDGDLYGADEYYCNLALGVKINAQQTFGTYEWGSVGSDTSLTIYNVNTLAAGKSVGNDEDAQETGVLTVRMDHTGPATPTDDAANLTVLLDNDYLLANPPLRTESSLTLQLMDIDNAIISNQPLKTVPFNVLVLTIDGEDPIDVVFDPSWDDLGDAAYAKLAQSIDNALADKGYGELVVTVGDPFQVTDPDFNPGGNPFGREILIVDPEGRSLTPGGFKATGVVPNQTDYQKEVFPTPSELTDQLITIDIVLNKVGREGDGGYLTAGGMTLLADQHYYDSLLANTWQGPAIQNPGIEQFEVTVEGVKNLPGIDQSSSLAGLQSTHNALQVVNVYSAEGSNADLTIGNSQTMAVGTLNGALYAKHAVVGAPTGSAAPELDSVSYDECCVEDDYGCDLTTERNAGLKDVRVFNSTEFAGNASIHGYFSSEVVAKYLDLMDIQDDPRADNLKAHYDFGAGNDLLNLNFSKDYYAYAGTVNREDFEFIATMGAGNDHVQIQIGNGSSWGEGEDCRGVRPDDLNVKPAVDAMVGHWYANHAINSFADSGQKIGEFDRSANFQLDISTDAGNDFVELWGSTVAHVNLGAGDDVIFTDNSGVCDHEFNCGMATWAFNSTHSNDIDNLLTLEPGTTGVRVANVAMRVTFQGIENALTVFVGGSNGATGAVISDLQVNQAIKNAINNDPMLGKVLVALDGPGRTLIVQSLIDGHVVENDLKIQLYSTGALTASQSSAGAVLLGGNTAAFVGIGFNPDGTPITQSQNHNQELGLNSDRHIWVDLNKDGVETANETFAGTGFSNRYDSFFAKDDGKIDGHDSQNVNNNVVEGSTGNDLIVLSSNGIGDGNIKNAGAAPEAQMPRYEGSSVETVVITGAFGEDTILNFTAAVADTAVTEVQKIVFGGTFSPYVQGEDAPGTVTVNVDGGTLPQGDINIAFGIDTMESPTSDYTPAASVAEGAPAPAGTPSNAAEIANRTAWGINNAANNLGVNKFVTASVSNTNEVILTYNANIPTVAGGYNFDEPDCTILPAPIHDEDTFTFQDNVVNGVEVAQTAAFTVRLNIDTDGNGINEEYIIDGDTGTAGIQQFAAGTTDTQVATAVAAQLTALAAGTGIATATVVSDGVEMGAVKVTYDGSGPHQTPTAAVTDSTNVTLNISVATSTYNYGLTCVETAVVNGRPGEPGWDIFDVTKVISGSVVAVRNDMPAHIAESDTTIDEAGSISWVGLGGVDNRVAITHTVLGSGDPGTGTSELARIQNYLATNDAGNATAYDGVLITVDADNRGYFYHVVNAVGAGNATASYLGSTELGEYLDPSKDAIGDWNLMSLANFTPLNANTVTDTFNIA